MEALIWLERFPGVGRKVSASVLNFSTLRRPAFVIDTHILRCLRRFGVISAKADTMTAYDSVMSATSGWSADDLVHLHIVLKRLGQTICRWDRGECRICPLKGHCALATGPSLARRDNAMPSGSRYGAALAQKR